MNESHPINLPYIREWEINENSSHYDRMMAAPSDWEMRIMWILWSIITGVVVLVAGVVFAGVVSSRKARENPFNLYLIFLMIPDLFFSFACFITCTLNASVGHFYSESLCYFQSYYSIFGIGANAWMNAVIAKELYTILLRSAAHQTFKAPKKSKVVRNALRVYMGCACVAGMGLLKASWWPHKTGLLMGTACIPTDYDTPSTIFFYCVYFPALMGIPMGYVLYCCYKIHRDGLLPQKGKRRLLTVYFLRLAAVFIVMWLPALLFFFIIGGWVHYWAVWAGGTWSHLQGLVSAVVSVMKPDVYNAVSQFLHCNFTEEDKLQADENATGNISKPLSKTNYRVDGKVERDKKELASVSPINNFSEVVGWKTQINDADEDDRDEDDLEEQPSPDEFLERWKIQLGRQHNFSEAVGWQTQVEPFEVYTGDEANTNSSSFVSKELKVDTIEAEGQQKLSQASDDKYNPKVNFYETELGKYYS